jgi:hypothetical protein
MIRNKVKMLLAGLALWAGATGSAAHAGSANGKADVVIVRPLTFITVDDIQFGNAFSSATAGTIVVPPSGARTATGGVVLQGATFQPARFAGQGGLNQNVQISMGANSYNLTRVGGGAPAMVMDTFTIGSTPTAQLTTNPRVFRISSPTGIFNFPVGATLRVNANQPAGTYQTTFAITLIYQ